MELVSDKKIRVTLDDKYKESGTSEQPKLPSSAAMSSGEVSLSIPVPTKIAVMPTWVRPYRLAPSRL